MGECFHVNKCRLTSGWSLDKTMGTAAAWEKKFRRGAPWKEKFLWGKALVLPGLWAWARALVWALVPGTALRLLIGHGWGTGWGAGAAGTKQLQPRLELEGHQ